MSTNESLTPEQEEQFYQHLKKKGIPVEHMQDEEEYTYYSFETLESLHRAQTVMHEVFDLTLIDYDFVIDTHTYGGDYDPVYQLNIWRI